MGSYQKGAWRRSDADPAPRDPCGESVASEVQSSDGTHKSPRNSKGPRAAPTPCSMSPHLPRAPQPPQP